MPGAWKKPLIAAAAAPKGDDDSSFPGLKAGPGRVETHRTEYEELQSEELIALESIYADDFVNTQAPGAWKKSAPAFCIRIKEPAGEDEQLALTLTVQFTATYPKTVPVLALRDWADVPAATQFKLQQLLTTTPRELTLRPEPQGIIYDLVEQIRDVVRDAAQALAQGRTLPSLEEERERHQAELRRQAEHQEQEEECRREEAAREEERVMGRMVDAEMERQRQMGRESKTGRGPTDQRQQQHQHQQQQPQQLLREQHQHDVIKLSRLCEAVDRDGNPISFTAVAEKTKLAEGTVSDVYTVRPLLLSGHGSPTGRPILALKQVALAAGDRDPREFRRQLKALEACLEHFRSKTDRRERNIMEVFDFWIDTTNRLPSGPGAAAPSPLHTVNILCPLADKGSLEELLQLAGRLDVSKVRAWTRALLDGLNFLHNSHITHQAIHPANVLLVRESTREVVPKLADVGYQRLLHNLSPRTRGPPGIASSRPAAWLAPELARQQQQQQQQPEQHYSKADVWDMGVVFLQMLFGLDVVIKYTAPAEFKSDQPLSSPLKELVARFFKLDPQRRSRPFELSSSEFLATDAPIHPDSDSDHGDRFRGHSRSSTYHLSASPRLLLPMGPLGAATGTAARFRRESGTRTNSRYQEDYVEEGRLGKGGFGEVVKARRKLDGQVYAVKKISQRSRDSLTEILKEIRVLSTLNHRCVVRYYTTWLEETEEYRRPSDSDPNSGSSSNPSSESDSDQDTTKKTAEVVSDVADEDIPFEFANSASQLDFISSNARIQMSDDDNDEDEDDVEVDEKKHHPKDDHNQNDDEDDGEENGESSDEPSPGNTDHVTGHSDSEEDDEDDEDDDDGDEDTDRKPARLQIARRRRQRPRLRTTLYISMEYCENRSLWDLISAGGLWRSGPDIWRLLRQIVEGLEHIHGLGIVHRDLKPGNVFISRGEDGLDQAKIGDFGLATRGQFAADRANAAAAASSSSSTLPPPSDRFTSNVGTATYAAPEVMTSGGEGTYSAKVDMYSLGIVLLEMCHPPIVGMERAEIMAAVRAPQPRLPADFHPPEPAQAELVLALLTHDPRERPSSADLLRGGRLPVPMETEQMRRALAGLTNPDSQWRPKILDALMGQAPAPARDYAYDLAAATAPPPPQELANRVAVKAALVAVFRRHGAVETDRSCPYPVTRSGAAAAAATAPGGGSRGAIWTCLDAAGTALQLPYDLTTGHARLLAKAKGPLAAASGARSYAFGAVFRDGGDTGQPRAFAEVDFDVVSADGRDLALREAEVLKVLDEIIVEMPFLSPARMSFSLGHSDLLQLVFDFCGVRPEARRAAADVLSRLHVHGFTWSKARTELRSAQVGLSDTTVDELQRFDFRDTPAKAAARLGDLFAEGESSGGNITDGDDAPSRSAATLARLAEVAEYARRMRIQTRVLISPLESLKESSYRGGVLFTCLQDRRGGGRDVFAAGGRYDSLIREHRRGVGNSAVADRHAVGFQLAWERLARLPKPSSGKASSYLKKMDDETAKAGGLLLRRCDILVASFNSAILRSTGLEILETLWAHDVSAELAADARTPDELMAQCRDETYWWVMIVKDNNTLRLKNMASRAAAATTTSAAVPDVDIPASQLAAWIRSELRDRTAVRARPTVTLLQQQQQQQQQQQHEPLLASSSSAGAVAAASAAGADPHHHARPKVTVLVAQSKSKKFNRSAVVEQAEAGAANLVRGFLDGAPVLAVETADRTMDLIRATGGISDAEGWKQLEGSIPAAERRYVRDMFDLLSTWAEEMEEKKTPKAVERGAFVYNFRSGTCLWYPL